MPSAWKTTLKCDAGPNWTAAVNRRMLGRASPECAFDGAVRRGPECRPSQRLWNTSASVEVLQAMSAGHCIVEATVWLRR